ncbi:MAG: hypothetical protein GX275_14645 [Clostridiales bacterium]|nr:hypothetical protein [Clostridiales bacterium]
MKKYIKFILILIIISIISFSVFKYTDKYKIKILKNSMQCSVITKGVNSAKAIAIDENKNLYIAIKDSIKVIDNEGIEKIIIKNLGGEIEDIKYKNNSIYIISGEKLIEYSIKDRSLDILINSMPYSGNNISRKLLCYEDKLLIAIGSKTNSGIDSNGEVENISEGRGDLINGGLYEFNTKTKEITSFASGIRGITGMDINSKGEIIALFSGINNNDERKINRDTDYIYKVDKGEWYGFPDFSGGNYITSPRFKGNTLVEPILKTPVKKIVKGPLMEGNTLDSLNEMAIDSEGKVLERDGILYCNNKDKLISAFLDENIKINILKLQNKSKIEDIIYDSNGFYILDSGVGIIYLLHEKEIFNAFFLETIVWILIGILFFSILTIIIMKGVGGKNEKNISG